MEPLAQRIVELTCDIQSLQNSASRHTYVKLMLKLYEISELISKIPFGDLLQGREAFMAEVQRVRESRALFLQNFADEDDI